MGCTRRSRSCRGRRTVWRSARPATSGTARRAAAGTAPPDNRQVSWFWHWLVHWTGGDYPAPYGVPYGHLMPYDWLSGILGLSFLGLFLTQFRKRNCHVRGCWRLGHHPFTDEATGAVYQLCRRHHPGVLDKPPTKETVDLIHARNQGLE